MVLGIYSHRDKECTPDNIPYPPPVKVTNGKIHSDHEKKQSGYIVF